MSISDSGEAIYIVSNLNSYIHSVLDWRSQHHQIPITHDPKVLSTAAHHP